ncbi:MAG TPA: FtsX-like permease family protein [Candidatus Lokiarchaeia archaeon]|nr:FtsX-like permease family protein [Candidatus Lokiarchaeia archaeon]
MPFYPTYFKFINGTLQSIIPNALIGFPIAFLADIISGYEISGALPGDGKLEILVGASIQIPPYKATIGDNFSLFDENFTVVGKVNFNNPILDNMFITSYSTIQSLFKLNGTCNEIFVPRNSNVNESYIKQHIESAYPFLQVLTSEDIDQISNSLSDFSIQWNSALPVFSIFITFSFSFSIFLLNANKLRKDMKLLSSIGTKTTTIIGFKILENLIVIFLGLVIGFILAMIIYPIFTVISFSLQQINTDVWSMYFGTLVQIIPVMARNFIPIAIQMITIGLVATSLPHIMLIRPNFKTKPKKTTHAENVLKLRGRFDVRG